MRRLISIILILFLVLQANSQSPQWFHGNGGAVIPNATTYNPAAQKYFDSVATVGILTTTEKDAWNAFVVSAIAHNYWDSIKVINPVLGSTSAMHLWNAKDPATFKPTESGTVTHTSTHMVGNGSTGYVNTNYNPTTDDGDVFGSIAVWVRNNVDATACVIGAVSATNRYLQIYPRFGNTFYGQFNTNNSIAETQTVSTSVGLSMTTRLTSTNGYIQRNSTRVGSNTSSALVNNNLYVLAQNVNGTAGNFTTYQVCFYMIADKALTTTQADDFYTDLNTLITALSR